MANTEADKIHEFLHGIQLDQFYRRIVDKLHVTRLNHFAHVTEIDLDDLGMSKPEQRRLFEALKKSRKKPLFGSFRRKKSKTKLIPTEPEADQPASPPTLPNPPAPPTPPTSTKSSSSSTLTCVINEKDLALHEMLGTGAFGYVRKGEWMKDKNNKIEVAVKSLKISRDSAFLQLQLDFTNEANGMSRLDHPHIIKLYGVVLSTPIMLVTELASLGCLLTCLRNENPKFLISHLCDFVVQVVSGMAYLETQHYIHRDLAARNLLLSAYDMVKIGDFGLMRPLGTEEDYYTMNPKGKVPFAWCPPESLKFRKFSHASDVWSFGITVMELFSYGEEPWPGLNCSQILQKVDKPNSERPLKPSHCPSKIYNVVFNHCWANDPAHRPTFAAIQNIMEQIRPQDVKAKRCYDSKSPQNLCFAEGDDVTLIEASPDASWWRGQNKRTGRVGLFPSELVDGGTSSGSSPLNIIRGGSFSKKVPHSPIACTPGKQNCDTILFFCTSVFNNSPYVHRSLMFTVFPSSSECGEDHVYDFPFIINSPNATSPVGTRARRRSFDNELTFSIESDSGYSSSIDKISRTSSECSRRDLNSSYENCRETPEYELMEPTIKSKPTRPVPIPDTENKTIGPANSDPVSTPNSQSKPMTVRERMSDPNPTPVQGFSKGRISETSSSGKPRSSGPFTLSRRVSAKKLKSFDVPVKSTRCPLDFTTTTSPSSLSQNVDNGPPPSLPLKKSPSSSRPNSRNSTSSGSPQRSPLPRPKSDLPQEFTEEESATKIGKTFARSCSVDGFASKSLKEAQERLNSPTEVIPSNDVALQGRSFSFGNPSQRGCERAELYENHDYIPRSKSTGSKSLNRENHSVVDKPGVPSFQNYDNHKLAKVDTKSSTSGPFYENHEIPIENISVINQVPSPVKNVEEMLSSNVYDNHRLKREFLVSPENHSRDSLPQSYEKMELRQSYVEKEEAITDVPKETTRTENVSYENFSVRSIKNRQACYENFVMVDHSDVPEEICSTLNNLKCPSYENHGFEELRAQAENELNKECNLEESFEKLVQECSRSLPNAGNWEIVKESLDNDGSLVVKMEQFRIPRLRKTSSDGDLRDSNQDNEGYSENKFGSHSDPVAPPRLKKQAKEAKKVRWSLDVTGELASALSIHMNGSSEDNTKEKVVITNNGVSLVDCENIIEPLPTQKDTSLESPKRLPELPLQVRASQNLDLTDTIEITQDTNSESPECTLQDVPPPLPERKKNSLSRVSKDAPGMHDSSYENVKRPAALPSVIDSSNIPPAATLPNESLKQSEYLDEEEAIVQPQRPNVLCFENKLATFPRILKSPQSPTTSDRTNQVDENVPALPPKVKSPLRSPSRRSTSKSSSNYPRLSRDTSDAKLTMYDDVQRYRPCPTNGSPNYEYPRTISSGNDDTPPPLPRKLSKSKNVPDVPPRTDLTCN
ncbi:hypothetical protein QZH41_010903 [Actinostola sp. cb2023]|nr:hypothetical protein QZH41_010903 [Actinostola sp. cb2023]